jgi:hypothetical protein
LYSLRINLAKQRNCRAADGAASKFFTVRLLGPIGSSRRIRRSNHVEYI